ncbi:uncharacterized protein AB9W97_012814 [Spinachia spinachia]
MGESEEANVFWDSWTWTPEKEKKKKDSKMDKKSTRRQKNITKKTDQTHEKKKKKKKSSFKEIKPEKKGKKKKRLPLELDESLILTNATPAVRPHALEQQSVAKLKSNKDCKKKSRKKTKVAFNLSPSILSARQASFVSCCQQSPKKKILSEPKAVRGLRHSQWRPKASQSPSEDINSQDLFITQKTFRASSSQPSSSEASDRAVTESPPVFPPQDELHSSKAFTKPRDSHFHQHRTKTFQPDGEEEEAGEKRVSLPAHTAPRGMKSSLSAPFQLSPSLDVAQSRGSLCVPSEPPLSCLSDQPSGPHPASTESTSTQTENFFTTELSSYLGFCQRRGVTVPVEDLQPLDLSVQQRAGKDLGKGSSGKTPAEYKELGPRPCCSWDMTDGAVMEEPCGHLPCSGSTQGKRKTTPSILSESDPKSADTSASSEDEPRCRSGRLDLTQVRAVQMRLNESFFFKTKGKGLSPRPQSPLMKLAQGRQVKSRKGH